MKSKIGLFSFVYLWFLALIALPLTGIAVGAFRKGAMEFFHEFVQPGALFGLKLTFEITACAVAINTVFGVLIALQIAGKNVRGWRVLNVIVDLPFAVSPVIAGLALILVYGPNTLIGGFLQNHSMKLMFAMPGMVMATLFVTLPFVVRELVPVLREMGNGEQEAAMTLGASTWRVFWRITLPQMKWSLLYGAMLTVSRALGEFGAVLVVSGSVVLLTQSATLYVYQSTVNGDMQAAYTVSLVLAATSFLILCLLEGIKRRREVAHS